MGYITCLQLFCILTWLLLCFVQRVRIALKTGPKCKSLMQIKSFQTGERKKSERACKIEVTYWYMSVCAVVHLLGVLTFLSSLWSGYVRLKNMMFWIPFWCNALVLLCYRIHNGRHEHSVKFMSSINMVFSLWHAPEHCFLWVCHNSR